MLCFVSCVAFFFCSVQRVTRHGQHGTTDCWTTTRRQNVFGVSKRTTPRGKLKVNGGTRGGGCVFMVKA